MLKKILKIVGIILLVLVLSLFAIPFFFKDQIKAKITDAINEKVDAKVSFEDADLSLFKSFPQANVTIDKLLIINKAPFEGDTLISLGQINLKMSIKELFKGKEESMNIEAVSTENGLINILFNKDGLGNFALAKNHFALLYRAQGHLRADIVELRRRKIAEKWNDVEHGTLEDLFGSE